MNEPLQESVPVNSNRISLQDISDLNLLFWNEQLEPIPSKYDADLLEHQFEQEICEEMKGLTVENIKNDHILMEELVTKVSSTLTLLYIDSKGLSKEWFMLEKRFPLAEVMESIALHQKGRCRYMFNEHKDVSPEVDATMTCLEGIAIMKSESYIYRKKILELANRSDIDQLYWLGNDLYDTYCHDSSMSTGKVLKQVLHRPLNNTGVLFGNLNDVSGHSLAKLSDLPAYRHDQKKRSTCKFCKKKSYTYCVQCTFFHAFPEVSVVCDACKREHKRVGYLHPPEIQKSKKKKVDASEPTAEIV